MILEQLESRALLASDSFAPPDAQIAFELGLVDPVTLAPVIAVENGDEFAVAVYTRDLRVRPEGVFAAYFDLEYPESMVEVSGPIVHRGQFTNGTTGSASDAGWVDEVGGFVDSLTPTDTGRQLVAAIPFRAINAGEVHFALGSADLFPDHDSLLFGDNAAIPVSAIEYGTLQLSVAGDAVEIPGVEVLNDDFAVVLNSHANELDVLANDVSPDLPLTILSVDAAGAVGHVFVNEARTGLIYSPPADFSGVDTFRYTVADAQANSDTGTVTVRTGASTEAKAAFRMSVTDEWGNPLSSLREGDSFRLQVGVEDLRSDPQGVFAAYMDVDYTATRAKVDGEILFGGTLTNGTSGTTYRAGLMDEVGGFQMQLTPVGDGVYPLFSVPMVATTAGLAIFQSSPADDLPTHEILLFGDNAPIDPTQIRYEKLEIEIASRIVAVDDSVDIPATAGPVTIPVLANDVAFPSPTLRISALDTDGITGRATISADGRSIVYQRAVNFFGSEQFAYTISDGDISDSAQVTVHVQDVATADDQLTIRLEITDMQGNVIENVAPDDVFQVRAYVADTRIGGPAASGVFAAYFDLLYEAAAVWPVPDESAIGGIDLSFGDMFQNVMTADPSVPGIIDEVGAVQTGLDPLGAQERLLFAATFQASAGRGAADYFSVAEDGSFELDVLANDSPNEGKIVFRSDPADNVPANEILFFSPAEPVGLDAIGYGSTSVNVGGQELRIVRAGPSRHGGVVEIVGDGQAVRYTPAPNFSGTDEFAYSLGTGPEVLVEVLVTREPDAPLARADSYVAPFDRPFGVDARRGVLANDHDLDGDRLVATLVRSPEHGSLALSADGSFRYTPDSDFAGVDTFTYQASDGQLTSAPTTVEIEVAQPPVRIRLETVTLSGRPVDEISVGDSVLVRAFVQDTRDDSRSDRGVGAAYLDLAYDAQSLRPAAASNRLGFAVTFGSTYQNATSGDIETAGLVDNVGALQTELSPVGRGEEELFAIQFDSLGPRAADDSFRVSKGSLVNVLNVLRNEQGAAWEISLEARGADNSPLSDIVLYEPAQAVAPEDVQFVAAKLAVRNSDRLTLQSVSASRVGGRVAIDPSGEVRYTPPTGFVGLDTFTYTIRDEQGRQATGTVTIEVTESWTNEMLPGDTNSDAVVTSGDALVVINDLNQRGPRQLPAVYIGHAYFDVNRDGHETALDVLAIINGLNLQTAQAESEGALFAEVEESHFADPDASAIDATDQALAVIWIDAADESTSNWRRTRHSGRRHLHDSAIDMIADDIAVQWNHESH